MLRRDFSPVRYVVAGALILVGAACGGLLDVSNPTLVRESDIANADGANAKRLNAVDYLTQTMSMVEADAATLSDEWTFNFHAGDPANPLDIRNSQQYESGMGTIDQDLGRWDQVFYETSIAIPSVRAYTPDSLRGEFLGQLYGIRGYAVTQVAEDFCAGFPLNDVSADNTPLFGGPLTTDSALAYASAQLDSAIKYAHDSTRFVTLARVMKGRVLIDQGKYAEAAVVVGPVATSSTYEVSGSNNFFSRMRAGSVTIVGDREGGNGMPFVSENDARIPIVANGVNFVDGTTPVYRTTKYLASTDPVVIASGVEARLIEAEAALNAGDDSWITILNDLRNTAISPALPSLVAPVAVDSQVDLLYRERAYWLYLTGHRLGDLRRLVKNYGRSPESVFPTGPYPSGGTYSTGTAIPFILAGNTISNPYITHGCTTR